MSIEIVHALPVDQWRAFVDEHPNGNVFHTPQLFEVFRLAKGHRPELWAALDGGEIQALFVPVHISLQLGWLRRLATRTVIHGSILATPDHAGRDACRSLLRAYKAASGRQSLFTETRNVSPLGNLGPLLEAEGFAYEDHLNYLLDLERPIDAIFEGIGKRTRKHIRNGLHKDLVHITDVREEGGLMECYRLLKQTFRAASVPLADYSLFKAALNILSPRSMIRLSIATVEGKGAATSVELLYKDVAYGWYAGMDRAYSSYVPNDLLMWDMLKWAAEHGFKRYDFGGAGKPNEDYGVRDFKAKFGGGLVCYGRNTWIPQRSLYLLGKTGYGFLRSFLYGSEPGRGRDIADPESRRPDCSGLSSSRGP